MKGLDGYIQVLHKTRDELKARNAELHAVEESRRKLMSEKTSLAERLTRLERKNAEVRVLSLVIDFNNSIFSRSHETWSLAILQM